MFIKHHVFVNYYPFYQRIEALISFWPIIISNKHTLRKFQFHFVSIYFFNMDICNATKDIQNDLILVVFLNTHDQDWDHDWIINIRMEDEPLQKLKKMQVFEQKEVGIQRLIKKIWKSYMYKDYFGNQIRKMICVGHFTMLMITKKLI